MTTITIDASDHTGRIGASRVAAILGKDKHVTPREAWLEIIGRADEIPPKPAWLAERARLGLGAEMVIKSEYEHQTGAQLTPERTLTYQGAFPENEAGVCALTASPDFAALENLEETPYPYKGRWVECKKRSVYAESKWDEAIPEAEFLQAVVQLAVARSIYPMAEAVDLAVWFDTVRVFPITATPAFEKTAEGVIGQLAEWWRRHVDGNLEPDPVSEEDMRARWAVARRKTTPLTDDASLHIRRYVDARFGMKRLKQRADDAGLAILLALGDAEAIVERADINGLPKEVELAHCRMTKSVDMERLVAENPAIVAEVMEQKLPTVADIEGAGHKALVDRYRTVAGRANLYVAPSNAAKEVVAGWENE